MDSTENARVKELVKIREDRAYRYLVGKAVISGEKLVQEVTAEVEGAEIFVLQGTQLSFKTDATVTFVSEKVLKKITGVVSPDPYAALVPMMKWPKEGLNQILILDRIQDPGNLGTLLRTAWALGLDGVGLMPGTVDPYNDKAIRASRGASFFMPTFEMDFDFLKAWKKEEILVADMEGIQCDTFTKDQKRYALVLGNEGQGVDSKFLTIGTKICIPMKRGVESLNVGIAGAILMYELRARTSHG